jgi:predicted ATP-dependent endonuclease of OLD family
MIEHIFIKNYKAFKKENIPLDKNTLLIGSNSSGKTTVLEALDLFFNNVFHYHYIIDKTKDVVVEIHINDDRYRKVFKAPGYNIDFSSCIGDMFEINHIKYLYVPKKIDNPKLLNDILTVNLTVKVSPEEQANIFKVSDYIDGIIGNSNYKLFKTSSKFEMNIDDNVVLNKDDYSRIISNITYQHLIIGIDNCEDNFDIDALNKITKYSYQTIFVTNDKQIVKNYNYYVSALYKGNKIDDLDTIKKRLNKEFNKTYLLVEGKYDVNWFETALKLLNKDSKYTVIPCGGSGNITYVKEQLVKEGFKTIVIMDGDTLKKGSLKRDVIEQYADVGYINNRFNLNLEFMPEKKHAFFKKFYVKDDVVKNVLSRWAKKNLTLQNEFVQELDKLLIKGVI